MPSEKHFTDREISDILSGIDTIPDRALFLFGLDSGARVSEVCTVRVRDIDFKGQIVRIVDHKKRGVIREIVVSKMTVMALKWYIENRGITDPETLLFPWTDRTLNRKLKIWCSRAHISPARAHWHALRHSFVVRARLKGWDVSAVRAQTGDSALTLLRVYSELTPDERRKIVDDKPIVPTDG